MRRHDFVLRRTTNLMILLDDQLKDKAVAFMSYLTSKYDRFDLETTSR